MHRVRPLWGWEEQQQKQLRDNDKQNIVATIGYRMKWRAEAGVGEDWRQVALVTESSISPCPA